MPQGGCQGACGCAAGVFFCVGLFTLSPFCCLLFVVACMIDHTETLPSEAEFTNPRVIPPGVALPDRVVGLVTPGDASISATHKKRGA